MREREKYRDRETDKDRGSVRERISARECKEEREINSEREEGIEGEVIWDRGSAHNLLSGATAVAVTFLLVCLVMRVPRQIRQLENIQSNLVMCSCKHPLLKSYIYA